MQITHTQKEFVKIRNKRFRRISWFVGSLSLPDEIESFRYMCLKIYEIDAAKFLSVCGLAWEAVLKKTKVILDLNRHDYLSTWKS